MAHIGGLVLAVLFFDANVLRSSATLRRWDGAVAGLRSRPEMQVLAESRVLSFEDGKEPALEAAG